MDLNSNDSFEFINNPNSSIKIEEKEKIYNNIKSSICKIVINDNKKGYGFFCNILNRINSNIIPVLITNYTTLSTEYIKTNEKLNILLNEEKEEKIIYLDDSRIYYTNENINITIIEINPRIDGIKDFLDLDDNIYKENMLPNYQNKKIYIIERPHFKRDFISISSLDKINNTNIECKLETCFGCIGTPIFNLDNDKIIGIHMNEIDSKENKNICFKTIIDNFINRNEIVLCISLNKKSSKKDVYFLNCENNESDCSEEINESTTSIYVNGKEEKFKHYFKPDKNRFYILKIKFNKLLTSCHKLFYNCKNINKIDLSSFNVINIKNTSYMFYNCSNLTNINLSSLNAENVTDLSYMFHSCSNLINIDLSSFIIKKAINLQNMFSLCINLKSINLSFFNTDNVSNISYMFKNCHTLKNLDLTSFNTKNVIVMNNLFDSCYELKDLILGNNFNTSNVTNMEKMFYDCQNLEKIDKISTFDTQKVIDMNGIFYNCKSLKNLDISKFNTDNVANMSKMFCRCRNLIQIDLTNFNTKNVKNMSEMFAYCNNLEEINVNHFNTENVIDMSEMFSNCKNLFQIDISSFNLNKINSMNKMFYNCNSLNNILIDFSKAKKGIDLSNIFSNCYSLHFIEIPTLDSENVKKMNLFQNCISLIGLRVNKKSYLDFVYDMNNNFKIFI